MVLILFGAACVMKYFWRFASSFAKAKEKIKSIRGCYEK
jgi:hypothetical protein